MDPSLSGGIRPTQKSSHRSSCIGVSGLLEPFILETDASLKGLGTVLSQKGDDNEVHVIAYGS